MIAPYYLVKGARYALGLTIREAAQAIGVTETTLRKAETGKSIRVTSWKAIKDYYMLDKGIDIDVDVRNMNFL